MDLDFTTIVIHLIVYLGLLTALKFLYFDPILRLLRKREALTSGRQANSKAIEEELVTLQTKYFDQLNVVKEELEQKRREALTSAKAKVEERISRAKKEAEHKLAQKERELLAELKDLRERLPNVATEIAAAIENSVLNSKVVRL